MVESTERGKSEEECGFRKDISCSDQIFVVSHLCEKMTENVFDAK